MDESTQRVFLGRGARWVLLVFCALAGGCGLAYEIVWTHELGLVAGQGRSALVIVLATFLGGMAVGGALMGRPRFRRRRALPLLAAAEAGLALCGLGIPVLLSWWSKHPEAFGGILQWGRSFAVIAVLLVPTFLMGATFPLWVRTQLTSLEPDRLATVAAKVGLVQLLGASLGAYVTGFFVVPEFGFSAASVGAATVGFVVALGCALLSRSEDLSSRAAPGDSHREPEISGAAEAAPQWSLSAACFLAGVASLGYQVVWTRTLVFYFDGFHFALSAVLATYLLGLAIGAAIVLILARRLRHPERWLSRAQVASGVLGLVALGVLPLLGEPAAEAARLGDAWLSRVFLLSACFLLIPSAFLGMTLPLAAWVTARAEREGGVHPLARAFALVTAGNAVGVVLISLVGIPWFGILATWALLAVLNALSAFLFLRGSGLNGAAGFGKPRLSQAFAGLLAVAAIAVAGFLISAPETLIEISQVFRGSRGRDRSVLAVSDGALASVAVVKDRRHQSVALYTDTFAAAATGREYPYMRLLGHLPLLLCKEPKRVSVICFGTGTTAGAVSLHPEVEDLRLVDVEAQVFAMASHFEDVNHGVLTKPLSDQGPKISKVIADGRFDLFRDREGFDVITLEPLMPYTLGAAFLYTKEFYELAWSRLRPGGVFCQWVPVHALPPSDYQILLRTFYAAFPKGGLFFFEQSSLLVVRKDGASPNFDEFQRRTNAKAVRADLAAALVSGPIDLLAAEVARGDALNANAEFASHPVMTDDHPVVALRKTRPESDPFRPLAKTLELLAQWSRTASAQGRELAPWISGMPEKEAERLDNLLELRRLLLEARAIHASIWWDAARTGKGVSLQPALDALGTPMALDVEHLETQHLLARLSFDLDQRSAQQALRDGKPLDALEFISRHRLFREWTTDAEVLRGVALLAAGDNVGSIDLFSRVLKEHPDHILALVSRARALKSQSAQGDLAHAEALDAAAKAKSDAWLQTVMTAAETGGTAPIQSVRRALGQIMELGDPFANPGTLADAWELWDRSGLARARLVLAAQVQQRLEAEDSTPEERIRAAQELALLGAGQSVPSLMKRHTASPSGTPETLAVGRAAAALVPVQPRDVQVLAASEDVMTKRLLAFSAAKRMNPRRASLLLPLLSAKDEEVRLWADRALRRLSGKAAGFDYLGSPADRKVAVERWAKILSEKR